MSPTSPYAPSEISRVIAFYKYVHTRFTFGILPGHLVLPHMTVTHLIYAIGLTGYLLVGVYYEEKTSSIHLEPCMPDGTKPQLIPFMKFGARNTFRSTIGCCC